ncbi:MAG: ClpXP protease specificity-enhancing factor SspB [Rhodospirillales bacterium]|nr:ClpXP protease specificity-enhancing factor SspB [Rhodospirillales bacterium]
MSKDLIGYNTLVEDGLRSVVREALRRVAEEGWPGTHHAYITFKTEAPGVEVPDFLHSRYPDELTIVLQHQFWDLEVEDDFFAVTLSFNKVGQRIVVPFAALTSYADPSVKFGLQFGVAPEARGEMTPPEARGEMTPPEARGETTAPEARKKAAKRKARKTKAEPEARPTGSVPAAGGEKTPPEAEDDTDEPESNGEKVVTLDQFRKK